MENDELVKALRNCACIRTDGSCANCGYRKSTECKWMMVRDAADALERLVADRNKLKDKLILNICSHCDSRFDYCGECPIIKDINEAFDEQ